MKGASAIMVFYFTGTCNSLYAARQLEKEPVSIPQEMKKEKREYESETIGIVCPVYAGELPRIVKRFLLTSSFRAEYFYMILTYGKIDSVAAEWSANFAAKTGIAVSFVETVQMVDNYLPAFDMEKEKQLDKRVDEQLAEIVQKVKGRYKGIPEPDWEKRALYQMAVQRDIENPDLNSGRQITVTSECIGCGICAKVCPVGNFRIEEGAAKRKKDTCEFCLACAQSCPQKAITLSISDQNPLARYRNEQVSLEDLIWSNHQI